MANAIIMQAAIKLYRRKFNQSLEPIKVMLVYKRKFLPHHEWLMLVEKVKGGIIAHPHEYIEASLPPHEIVRALVEDIFKQFIADLNSRS